KKPRLFQLLILISTPNSHSQVAETEQTPIQKNHEPVSWKTAPFLAIKGFIMGSADVVPGVSGGTMALILGIYKRLIDAIRSFDVDFLKHFFTFKFREALAGLDWKFLFILISGIVSA